MANPNTYTLWKYNDKTAKLTYSVTLRLGWTPTLLQESRNHYVAACQAAIDGKRQLPDNFINRADVYDCDFDEAMVQFFGDVAVQVAPGIRQTVTINCFDENTSGQELLDELWAVVDALQAIDAMAVLEQAQPPQAATLRPSRQRVTDDGEVEQYE